MDIHNEIENIECDDILDNIVRGNYDNVVSKKRRMSVCQMKQMKSQNKGNIDEYNNSKYREKHNLTIPQLWQQFAKRVVMLQDSFKNFKNDIRIERVVRYQYNSLKKSWSTDECFVKIENKSFNNGAMRECFRVKKIPTNCPENWKYATNYVAKKYMQEVERHVYFEDVRLQMDAKLWAEEFNNMIGVKRKVDIVKMCLIEFVERPNRPLYHLEHFIEGTYIKYNSNSGFVDENTRNTPQAFSHFTFERSGHELIVVDIQGVGDLYTDPQIHTMCQTGYGDGNLGCRGMALFFHSHICNRVCTSLGLAEFDLAPTEFAQLSKNSPLNIQTVRSKSTNFTPLKSLRVSRISTSRESALINILDETAELKEDPASPDILIESSSVRDNKQILLTQMSSPDSGFGYPEEEEETTSIVGQKRNSAGDRVASNRRRFQFDSGTASDDSTKHESDSISSFSGTSHKHRPSCAAFVLMQGEERGESILGKIHHEIANMHESGRFINKEDVNDEIDWAAVLYHEDMAAKLNYHDSVVSMAHYYLDLPEKHFMNSCIIKPNKADVFKGWIYLTKAANNKHLPSIITMANSSDVNSNKNDINNNNNATPDWQTVVHWLEIALDCLNESDSLDASSYEIKARLGSMFRKGGYGLKKDLERAMDLYNEAAEEATASMKGRLANKYYEIVEEISGEMDEEE